MNNELKVSFYLKREGNTERTETNPDAVYPIVGKIIIGNTIAQFGSKLKIEERLWNVKSGRAIILDLPIVTINKGLLPIFEDYMNEIQLVEEQQNKWSNSVRRHLIHSLSISNLKLDFVAERFNMSKRSLHRKLKEEGTSYQQILDSLRMELSRKYLKEKIPLVEIAHLLGFESQSAFNKFFQKHFQIKPSQFR